MIRLTIADVLGAVAPTWSTGVDPHTRLLSVSTDSRHMDRDCLFVGLPGPRFDGAAFALDAVQGGAACLLVEDGPGVRERLAEAAATHGVAALTCEDARVALGRLASLVRDRLDAVVFGITGSCGKTTTKGILAAVLASESEVVSSPASFNNDVGVPRTILLADERTEALVVEIGTSGPGEIRRLTAMARPRVAIVTCVGRSHLEGLGSIEGVAREKGDLVAGLEGTPDALCVLNLDCPRTPHLMRRVPPGARLVTVSARGDRRASLYAEDLRPRADGTTFRLGGELAEDLGGEHFVSLLGEHAVGNSLLALAPLAALGAPVGRMARCLAGLSPQPHRLAPRRAAGVDLVDDTYNANPESVAGAIDVLANLACPRGRRVLVLGHMAELGDESVALHRAAGEAAAAAGLDRLVLVGGGAYGEALDACADGARAGGLEVVRAADRDCAAELLAEGDGRLVPGDVALLKGSRSAGLDLLVDHLAEALAARGAGVPGEEAIL